MRIDTKAADAMFGQLSTELRKILWKQVFSDSTH